MCVYNFFLFFNVTVFNVSSEYIHYKFAIIKHCVYNVCINVYINVYNVCINVCVHKLIAHMYQNQYYSIYLLIFVCFIRVYTLQICNNQTLCVFFYQEVIYFVF